MGKTIKVIFVTLMTLACLSEPLFSQATSQRVSGVVTDQSGVGIIGATVLVQGTSNGTVTDLNGKFSLSNVRENATLLISYIGMLSQEIKVDKRSVYNIVLADQAIALNEVVAVGYGVQKKASLVGAIASTSSKELQRVGGVSNLGSALTGLLPGLTTIQSTGQPGDDDPIIFIRGQGTWNGGEPYILVDGVERSMKDIDVNEVESISILKDASATAVYGVKGANGVILITTKRGAIGKPVLSVSATTTSKFVSKVLSKLDAYDTYLIKNAAIEREVAINEASWGDYTPLPIVQRYRNQQNLRYPEAYPNVDWLEETIKDYTFDTRANINVSGGTEFAKYFSSLAYNNQSDIFKIMDNGRGYKPGMGFDKFNFRTNLDLNLTKTTLLKFNLAGIYSRKRSPQADLGYTLLAYYQLPPNAFLPRYEDGRWGKSNNIDMRMANSAAMMANYGYSTTTSTNLTTDIGLSQKLDFITKGLSFNASLSFDNSFGSTSALVDNSSYPTKYIDPAIEDILEGEDPNKYITIGPISGSNQFTWVETPWGVNDESPGSVARRLYYQAQLNYAREFGKHDVTATGVFTREQRATGNEFQRFREDWVARATYNYDNRYLAEFNGAYNGSEKFGPAYRFAFFPSGAVGWTVSNENFMKEITWLDRLKLRYSYGLIGDDSGLSQRWLYETQWKYGGKMPFSAVGAGRSPYTIYRESVLGNPDIHWEKARKSNLGLDLTVFKNFLSANVEYFTEDRTDILLLGSQRILPPYFGSDAPTANVGRVKKNGYEVELRFNKQLGAWHFWLNTSITHAVDKIIDKEEPQLLDSHLKDEGYQIAQNRSVISFGYLNTWDDIYASTALSSNDGQRLPGDYGLLDFNGDGVLDGTKDAAPYGYSTRPQNNYNMSLGADYKGFSGMLQFYGVNNVTRNIMISNFVSNLDVAYDHTLDYWSKENPNASSFLPRWKTSASTAQYYLYDGSYLRLKTAELAYTFSGNNLKKLGLSSLKIFLNGNDLIFWSKLPDDREYGTEKYGGYPNTYRVNLGFDLKF